MAKSLHGFKEVYLIGQHERQLTMYSLDLCVSYSTLDFVAIFTAHNSSRKALNFYLNYLIDYLITADNKQAATTRHLIVILILILSPSLLYYLTCRPFLNVQCRPNISLLPTIMLCSLMVFIFDWWTSCYPYNR